MKRFWDKVNVLSPDQCWEWNAGINSTGRGIFWFNRSIHAHRMAWILTYGDIPKGLCVCHICDNGKCCNPLHLFLGTVKENTMDMIRKGRKNTLRGEDDPKSKLTEEQVRFIRKSYKPKVISQFELARQLHVSRSTIQSVLERRNWKHVV